MFRITNTNVGLTVHDAFRDIFICVPASQVNPDRANYIRSLLTAFNVSFGPGTDIVVRNGSIQDSWLIPYLFLRGNSGCSGFIIQEAPPSLIIHDLWRGHAIVLGEGAQSSTLLTYISDYAGSTIAVDVGRRYGSRPLTASFIRGIITHVTVLRNSRPHNMARRSAYSDAILSCFNQWANNFATIQRSIDQRRENIQGVPCEQ